MARLCIVLFVVMLSVAVLCKPVENDTESSALELPEQELTAGHSLWKRFINPAFAFGSNADSGLAKMRTKRGIEEECERLNLCRLHARSATNFVSAFELYFVNKENAKLWDHHAHSLADCERRFGDCDEERR